MYWQAGVTAAGVRWRALSVRWRAASAVWREHARILRGRARESGHFLTSLALVVLGMAGGLSGGALVGRWCLGLVLIAESALLVVLGLSRDDGGRLPRRGARTVAQVLEDERLRQ